MGNAFNGGDSLLLVDVIYVFSIMFTQLHSEAEPGVGYFENMPHTFHTLLMIGVFTEQREFISHMQEGRLLYYFSVIFFLLVGSYTVLHMLLGVICEVIFDVANGERED